MVSVAELCGCRRLVAVAAMVLCVLSCVLGRTTATAPGPVLTPPLIAHFPFDGSRVNANPPAYGISMRAESFDTSSYAFGVSSMIMDNTNLVSLTSTGISYPNNGGCFNSVSMSLWVYVSSVTYSPLYQQSSGALVWSLQTYNGQLRQQLAIKLCVAPGGNAECQTITQSGGPAFNANTWTHVLWSLQCSCTGSGNECQWAFYTNGQGGPLTISDFVYWNTGTTESASLGYSSGSPGTYFFGKMDEFWVFKDDSAVTAMSNTLQVQSLLVNNTYPCSPGYWVSDVLQSTCAISAPATYNPFFGQVQSTFCPLGQITPNGATSIEDCTACPNNVGGSPLPTCCDTSVSDYGSLQWNLAKATINQAGDLLCASEALVELYEASSEDVEDVFGFVTSNALKLVCGGIHMADFTQSVLKLVKAAQDYYEYSTQAPPDELQQQFCSAPRLFGGAAYLDGPSAVRPTHMSPYHHKLMATCERILKRTAALQSMAELSM